MKRKRGANTSKTIPTVVNPDIENERSGDEEPECKVESFVKVKRNKKKDSGGFLFLIKWIGYPDSLNTWEPMSLIDDWDIEREHIYKFFEDELIDVSGCDAFDFVHGEFKKDLKEKYVETKENTGKEEEKGTGGDEEDSANDEDATYNTDVVEETTKKSAADEEETTEKSTAADEETTENADDDEKTTESETMCERVECETLHNFAGCPGGIRKTRGNSFCEALGCTR